jgi:multidrug efflux pump subunit AcrA (membrane-fusion protein)
MIRKFVLPVIALCGALYAARVVALGSQPAPVALPVAEPARPPFDSYIAGSGIIEAASRNIAIGSPSSRLVAEVLVQIGDEVPHGAPLYRLESRVLEADLTVRKAELLAARAKLERLRLAPRPEEIPPAQARVDTAEATLADLSNQVKLWTAVSDRRAVSEEDLSRKRFAQKAAEARLTEARSQLELLKAGTWKPELEVAQAEVVEAEAHVVSAEAEIARLTVRAPVAGTVLQVNIRPGELAVSGPVSTPLILFGVLDPLHVRVDVDENDAWRFQKDAEAVAFVRGNRDLKTKLKLAWVEPFVVPKRSLTGDSTERVDTRVMQVVYSFDRKALPVYLGQQMDVFIQAPLKAPASAAGEGRHP